MLLTIMRSPVDIVATILGGPSAPAKRYKAAVHSASSSSSYPKFTQSLINRHSAMDSFLSLSALQSMATGLPDPPVDQETRKVGNVAGIIYCVTS